MAEQLPEYNTFMMCEKLDASALSGLPTGYHFRTCRHDELDIWKTMPFDDEATAQQHYGYMTAYFEDVYSAHGDLFYKTCVLVCDGDDTPIGTCFAWQAYNSITTIHLCA